MLVFFFKQKTAYEMRISDWSSDVCSSDLLAEYADAWAGQGVRAWADRWWEMPVEVGNDIAPLIGAGDGEVAMIPNVTIGQAAVLSAEIGRASCRERVCQYV